jgi:hypothetical protein
MANYIVIYQCPEYTLPGHRDPATKSHGRAKVRLRHQRLVARRQPGAPRAGHRFGQRLLTNPPAHFPEGKNGKRGVVTHGEAVALPNLI